MIPKLEPVDENAYQSYPLADLAAYTMAILEDNSTPLTIENITVALFWLFPVKFSLVGFPEYPDGMRANRTLLQMQPKYRNYATGSATTGYSLTALGRRIADRMRAALADAQSNIRLNKDLPQQDTVIERPRTIQDADLIRKVRESDLFMKFAQGKLDEARGLDFMAMIEAFSHTPPDVIIRKFKQLVAVAERSNDPAVIRLLSECKHRFGSFMRKSSKNNR